MPANLIADYLPKGSSQVAADWNAGEKLTITLDPITLPAGRTLADFDEFTLTVRKDPSWPRCDRTAKVTAMAPAEEGWEKVVEADGTVVGETLVFTFNAPTVAGERRYVVDARGLGGAAGPVSLLRATWVTVVPTVG